MYLIPIIILWLIISGPPGDPKLAKKLLLILFCVFDFTRECVQKKCMILIHKLFHSVDTTMKQQHPVRLFIIVALLAVAKFEPSSDQSLRSERKAQAENYDLLQTLAEMNAWFNNVRVGLLEWPSELQETLGGMTELALATRPIGMIDEKLPLLIDLHGGGSRWWEQTLQEQLETAAEQGMKRGYDLLKLSGKAMFGLNPNTGVRWEADSLDVMLDNALENSPNVDTDRVYVMGYSAGGGATWRWINQSGDRFAAASPDGFRGKDGDDDIEKTKSLPIWAIAGGEDGRNPSGITAMAERLEAAGNENVVIKIRRVGSPRGWCSCV